MICWRCNSFLQYVVMIDVISGLYLLWLIVQSNENRLHIWSEYIFSLYIDSMTTFKLKNWNSFIQLTIALRRDDEEMVGFIELLNVNTNKKRNEQEIIGMHINFIDSIFPFANCKCESNRSAEFIYRFHFNQTTFHFHFHFSGARLVPVTMTLCRIWQETNNICFGGVQTIHIRHYIHIEPIQMLLNTWYIYEETNSMILLL